MKEFILWATNPNTNEERPISEKVYDIKEQEHREKTARANGWLNVRTQTIDFDNMNIEKNFINAILVK